jgi:hypothetical protein
MMSEKIQASHPDREACVYIRQSSMSQLRNHLEVNVGSTICANVQRLSGFSESLSSMKTWAALGRVPSSGPDSVVCSRLSAQAG